MPTREQVAIHEAGHAVISRVLGLPSYHTTITFSGDGPRSYLRDDNGTASILTALAGAAAELEILGSICDGSLPDLQKATRLLDGKAINQSFEQARDLVRRHRGTIERVAQALLTSTTLDAVTLDRLVVGRR